MASDSSLLFLSLCFHLIAFVWTDDADNEIRRRKKTSTQFLPKYPMTIHQARHCSFGSKWMTAKINCQRKITTLANRRGKKNGRCHLHENSIRSTRFDKLLWIFFRVDPHSNSPLTEGWMKNHRLSHSLKMEEPSGCVAFLFHQMSFPHCWRACVDSAPANQFQLLPINNNN